MKFYLIGFRGVGKSTIGRELARRWGLEFLDLDEKFEQENGSILKFIEMHGIEKFREKEHSILQTSEAKTSGIISTGGGWVDWELSRQFMQRNPSPKVLLEADLQEIWRRIQSPEKRKVLNLQSFEQMEALFQAREPFYHKIATFRVPSQDITVALTELDKLRDQLWQAAP